MELLLLLVVFVLSIVQTVMGVGLLLFGTPTLMLIGMGFGESIAALLPCSLVVALLQLRSGLPAHRGALWRMVFVTLPILLIGLWVALNGASTRYVPLLVGCGLLGLGILRCVPAATAWLVRVVTSHQGVYLAVMGLVHGVSNMGGGLLVVFAGTLSRDKEEIRRLIAAGYVLFASTQIAAILLLSPQHVHVERLYLPLVSALTYLLGERLFVRLSALAFGHLLTGFIFAYGVIVVGKFVV